ncbi:phosphate ABC transporter substrate-binding protein PstS [Tessaracoccus sp. OS52]|uniref:phosphate ABC transporter substrate-binding protein PstS n=1 Tax=Tessaracoccus sp. OS52 TaxID=2886691 RepID=UPI001D115F52|nr:phosphate ABC transporter substrate-binding protein PstS [Tessaracoccus sp. OS52]MCC2594635.1 phosphate ABC transporter substrate-binding protein PstS [Tessaracoccus sp. OS52]
MKLRLSAALGLSAALLLSACAANEQPTDQETTADTTAVATDGNSEATTDATESEAPSDLSGSLNGIGSSAMNVAQTNWIAEFQTANPGVTVLYSPDGSGAGRDAFTGGGADFAGSDRAFKADENVAGAFANCTPESIAYDLPVYISPIAVIFNVEGVEELNLTPAVLAGIFAGDITNWNAPEIAELNEGAELPDLAITPVHRSDDSGTTENFTDYLNKAAGDVWTNEADGEWPIQGGEAAKGTSGVVAAVTNGVGAIGYADASQAEGLSIAKVGKDGEFFGPTAEDAAAAVEASPVEEGREEHDLALELDRNAGGYPIVLVAYALACADYADDEQGALVKEYLGYIASPEGQEVAAAGAGSAPLSDALSEKVLAAIDAIA